MTQTITIKEPQAPASEKQIHFLFQVLLVERDCPTTAEKARFAKSVGLTKGVASKLIDEALKAPKKGATKTANPVETAILLPKAEAPKPLSLNDAPFGYYEIDGTIFYWDCTGKDAFPILRKLHILTNWDGSTKGSWKKYNAPYSDYKSAPLVEITYTPYGGKGYHKTPLTKNVKVPTILAKAILAGATPLDLSTFGAKGKAYGFCIRCGATLTDPVSVANGYGPVCAAYFN